MERRNSKEWINSLKIALINNDIKRLKEYSNRDIPSFSSIDEAKEALKLVNQATNVLNNEKEKVAAQLRALKQNKKYLQTTNTSTVNFQV